jgi:hypothetical protein
MDTKELANTAIIGLCILGVAASGIGGCTYLVAENNRQYYETMTQCISSGGNFVPTKGDGSSAVCIRR